MLKLFAGAMALSALVSPVVAATLDGDGIVVSYVLNGTTTTFGTFTPPDLSITVAQDPGGVGSISGNTVSYAFGNAVDFDAIGLTSVTLTDDNLVKTITGVSVSTDMVSGLLGSNLAITSDSFTIGLAGVTAEAGGTVSFIVSVANVVPSAVPLPGSAQMFGAALVALGAAGYSRKRSSKAVD